MTSIPLSGYLTQRLLLKAARLASCLILDCMMDLLKKGTRHGYPQCPSPESHIDISNRRSGDICSFQGREVTLPSTRRFARQAVSRGITTRVTAPRAFGKRRAENALFVLADLIADEAADGCTADCSESVSVRKNGTADRPDTGTDSSISIPYRHLTTAI
jgi:hypothetical protein